MLLQVTHDTLYRYQPAVEDAHHVACLQPTDWGVQQVLDHTLTISPQPAYRRIETDAFGNPRCFFALPSPHAVLQVVASSLVQTAAPPVCTSLMPWPAVREQFRYRGGVALDPASEFVFASPFVPRHAAFADYARTCFDKDTVLLEACVALTDRIHSDFTYESFSTDVDTPALRALEIRKGVCQDFAHIMIACLRSLGVAARYVSGYLLTAVPEGQQRLIGSDASHAWVSVYVPDVSNDPAQCWVDFDPTNNRWGWMNPGEDYVQVARGRDFGDVSPLRGVIRGGARHTLTVGVTVQPVGDNAPLENLEKP